MNLETDTRLFLKPQNLARRAMGDRAFKWLTLAMALVVFVLIGLIGCELARGSHLEFADNSLWNPVLLSRRDRTATVTLKFFVRNSSG